MSGASNVVTSNVADKLPARTTTVAGTVATPVLLLLRFTVTSVSGVPFRVTVPMEVLLPLTVSGLRFTESTPNGLMVKFAPVNTPL